ncbi:MAG TPA: hypothetical protein VL614_25355 [Acetobacteraceae bacterium]|nr:hypothetical protein [Acetobacteraceae bacterium]
MSNNNGINNAQNQIAFNQTDNAIAAQEQDASFGFGSLAAPQFRTATTDIWTGTGNPNANWNLTNNGDIQLGEKVIHRGGADYLPSSTGPNGEQIYNVLAGTQSGNPARAEWNWGYSGTTAAGTGPTDPALAGAVQLNADDFKMQITESRPGFIASDVFDLDTTTHVWTGEKSGLQFGGDDFAPGGAPAAVRGTVFQNLENVAFLQGDFFGTLAQETSAGTQWDFTTAAFAGGSPHLLGEVHDHVNVVATLPV